MHTLLTAEDPVEEAVCGSKLASVEKRKGPCLIREEEEKRLIQWIGEMQVQGNCPKPRQVRDEAAKIYDSRTGEFHEFDRCWWKRFKMKHDEVLTTWVHAIEGHRVEVLQSDVAKYFSNVMSALMTLKMPKQLVNLNDVGLCQRPDKGRRRRVVALKSVQREPSFREEDNGTHVTFTAAVSQALRPHFLGMAALKFRERDYGSSQIAFLMNELPKGDKPWPHLQITHTLFSRRTLKVSEKRLVIMLRKIT